MADTPTISFDKYHEGGSWVCNLHDDWEGSLSDFIAMLKKVQSDMGGEPIVTITPGFYDEPTSIKVWRRESENEKAMRLIQEKVDAERIREQTAIRTLELERREYERLKAKFSEQSQ